MYMGKGALVEHLESFGDAVGELFNNTIDEVEWPEVGDRLRKIRDIVYFMIIDLVEDLESE